MTASDEIAALAEALMYCPDTGALTWRRTVSARAVMGGVVGWRNRKGHLVFTFNRKRYRVHRVAFALIWGRWPAQQIDHKNGDPADNRWSNLREVDNATNCQNRHKAKCRAGLIGAHVAGRRFQSEITVNGARYRLGLFDTAIDAHRAYCRAREQFGSGYPVSAPELIGTAGAPPVPQEADHARP